MLNTISSVHVRIAVVLIALAAGLSLGSLMATTAQAQPNQAEPAQAHTFEDVGPADWFYEAVEGLGAQGAISGHDDGTFRPYEPITRAQFAVMMAGALHLPPGDGSVFRDVSPDDWYAGALGALYARGIARGSVSGLFLPYRDLSREQAASLVMRAVACRLSTQAPLTAPDLPAVTGDGDMGHGTAPEPEAESTAEEAAEGPLALLTDQAEAAPWLAAFRDCGVIGAAHSLAVANAYRVSVISGFPDQRFYPFLDLTRSQAAGMLYEALLEPLSVREGTPAPVLAEAAYPTLERGDGGPMVAWMERRLAALAYRPGALDGLYDKATADAVMAFQKVERLQRTGTATDAVLHRLASAATPAPRRSVAGSRVEIDLTRQVLFVIRDNQVQWSIPVASGAQGTRTPTGTFTIQRKLPYWRESYLGLLYKPAYFYGGYAIHGSHSVPAYPASHGCVRVAVGTMDALYPLLPIGMRVDIYY